MGGGACLPCSTRHRSHVSISSKTGPSAPPSLTCSFFAHSYNSLRSFPASGRGLELGPRDATLSGAAAQLSSCSQRPGWRTGMLGAALVGPLFHSLSPASHLSWGKSSGGGPGGPNVTVSMPMTSLGSGGGGGRLALCSQHCLTALLLERETRTIWP